MASKKQKLGSKRNRKIEGPSHDYDHEKFVNESAAKKFSLISTNCSFIKDKGFHHPEDFFRKTIAKKGWGSLCQPPRLAATMVVREFYANLAAHVLKKVQVHGVLVDFNAKSINAYYNLESVNAKPLALLSGPTRLADSNRFQDAHLILFIYRFIKFYFSKMSRPESPARPEVRIRTSARFTPTVFIYLIKTFYLCHFILGFSITRKHFQMVGP